MRAVLDTMKNITLTETLVTIKSTMNEETVGAFYKLAEELLF